MEDFLLNRKSLIKFGKWSVGLLTLAVISFLIFQIITLVSAVHTINATTTVITTSLTPSNFSKNNTAESFNITVALSAGNSTSVNITVPGIAAERANYSVTDTSVVTDTGWTVYFPENYTTPTNAPRIINVTMTTKTNEITSTNPLTVNFTATPVVNETSDNSTQTWTILGVEGNTTETQSLTILTYIDSRSPVLTNPTPANSGYIKGTSTQLFEINISEQYLNVSNVSVTFRIGTGGWNTTYLSCFLTAPNFACNKTLDLGPTKASEGDTIQYYFEASDNTTNYGSNGTQASPLSVVIDKTPPQYSAISTSPASPVTYVPGKSYIFNVTWTDTNAVSKVTFEWNASTNYTDATSPAVASLGSNKYSLTLTDLGVSTANYTFKWYANDTVTPFADNNQNVTPTQTFNITVNTSTSSFLHIKFNGTADANATYTYPNAINATGYKDITEGVVTLYRNTTNITAGATQAENNVLLGNATWNFTVYYPATQNYSTGSKTFYAFVEKGSVTISLQLNGTQDNKYYIYPQAINATGNKSSTVFSEFNISLYRNGTIVGSSLTADSVENNVLLGNGTYNFTLIFSGSTNYTDTSIVTRYAYVQKGNTLVRLFLNGTEANLTIQADAAVNATATVNNSEGNISLWREGALYNSSITLTQIENISTYPGAPAAQFNITASYATTANYTSNISTFYVIVESTLPREILVATSNITNNTIVGKFMNGTVLISAQWIDAYALNNYWLSSNETGSFVNASATAFAAGNWTNVTINFSSLASSATGKLFQALVYANDTSKNQNRTATFQWTIDGTAPSITSPTPSNFTYINGSTNQLFQVTVTDDTLNTTNVTAHWAQSANTNPQKDYNNVTLTCYGNNPNFTCNTTIDLSGQPNGRIIYYYFEASDGSNTYGNSGSVSAAYNVTIDRTPPQSSNVAANATLIGKYDGVLLSVQWTDNENLSYATLETNESGTARNYTTLYGSLVNFTGGITGWSNFTWSNSSLTAGTAVSWIVYANDTFGHQNKTTAQTFSLDNTVPVPSNMATNTTNATVIAKGAQVNVSASWNDNYKLDRWWVRHNGTGSFANTSATTFTTGNWSNNTISTSTFSTGVLFQATIYANDTTGNENSTVTFQWTIDGTVPQVFAQDTNTTNATTIAKGTVISLTANWIDNIGLGYWWLWKNDSSVAGSNGTATAFTATNNSNASSTIATASFTSGILFQAKFYANDTSGNENISQVWQWTVDGTAPTIENISTSPTSPVVYLSGRNYIFNVSVGDAIGVGNVLFEFNTTTNYTSATTPAVTSLGSNNYSITISDLGVSTANYTFRWYANDTSNNFASSALQTFNITANTTNPVNLFLNDSQASLTVIYPQQINATTTPVLQNTGTLKLFRNNVDVTSQNNTVVLLPNGTHTYVANITGNINYTTNATGATFNVLVNKGVTNISLFLNGNEANISLERGNSINFTSTINTTYSVSWSLVVNISGYTTNTTTGTRIENVTATGGISPALYNVTANFSGDENFTADSQTWWLTLTQDSTGPTVKLFDYTNGTVKRTGQSLTLNVSVSDSGVGATGTVNVTIGGTSAGTLASSGSGWYNGTVTVPSVSNGNQTIVLNISDTLNNVGTNNSFVVTVDTTPPIITVTLPTNNTYTRINVSTFVWINGTVSDDIAMGSGNVSINDTSFGVFSFNGTNNTAFSIRNSSAIADGRVAVIINYTDSAGQIQNVTLFWFEDQTPPSAIAGLTNSSTQTYPANASLIITVRVNDAQQTNGTIILNYHINGSWFTAAMTGTPSTSTTYTAAISTLGEDYRVDPDGRSYIPYYVSGVDNATNNLANVNGSATSPLANITIGSTGSIDGYVLRNETTIAVSGATVSDGTRAAVTNSNGYYIISSVPAGTYTVTATATNYVTNSTSSVSVTTGVTTRANITMQYNATGTIQGYVLQNATSTVISGATVSDGTRAAISSSTGFYQITGVPVGTYTLSVSATNYLTNSSAGSVTVTAGGTNNVNVTIASNATGTIQGYVFLTNRTIVPNSTASLAVSDGTRTVGVNTAGFYQITGVAAGTYTVTVSGNSYSTNTTSATVTVGATAQANVSVTGAENFNITLPGTSGTSTTGFWDAGWRDFNFRTGVFADGTTNHTVEYLFLTVGKTGSYNYTAVWRYNATSQTWSSFIPQTSGNTLVNVSSSDDHYWVYMNATDRAELEARYT